MIMMKKDLNQEMKLKENDSLSHALLVKNSGFTYDLLNCFGRWKMGAAEAAAGTLDH
jgi:hypothetical protein